MKQFFVSALIPGLVVGSQTVLIPETRYRTKAYSMQVPLTETHTHTHNVTEMKSVPRQKTDTYTERVPYVVTKQIQVPVTKTVAQQITEQVPVTIYDVIEEPVSDCVNCDAPAAIIVPQPRSILSIPSPPKEEDAR